MSDFICSRRQAIGAAALALAPGNGLHPWFAGHDDFSFVVANDLHYRDARCGEWLGRVVAHIRARRPAPAFCVLDGDLSESGTREQLGAVRELFRPLPMPVHVVIGNHDYDLGGERTAFAATFGTRWNGRLQHGGWEFLALDSTDGRAVYRTRISDPTLAWLDRTLPGIKCGRPLVVLTHFPLGRNWLRPRNADAVLDRLRGHDLRAVLSGHWHGNTERIAGATALSTSRCCSWWRTNHDGSPLKGYTLCRARDGRLAHEFIAVS